MGEVAKDRLRLDGRRLPFGKQAAVIRAAGSSASVLETFQRFAGNQAVADLIRSADAPASTSTRDFVRPVGEDASELQRTESSAAERPQSQHAPLNGPERFLWPQVENSVAFIMRKLNETYLSDEDEQLVIQQLRYWASVPNPPGSKERDGSRYLEHIFKRLSMATKDVGIVADQLSSYYSILLNRFDRANEVRDLRDALAPAFRGDEGTAESSWGQFFWDDVKKGVIEQQIYGYFEGLADAAVGFGESIVILIRAAAGDPQAMRTFLEGLAALPEVVIQFWEKRHELLDEFLSAPPRKQARVIGRIIGEIEIFLLTRKAGQSAAGASTGAEAVAETLQVSGSGETAASFALDLSKLGPALQATAAKAATVGQISGGGNKAKKSAGKLSKSNQTRAAAQVAETEMNATPTAKQPPTKTPATPDFSDLRKDLGYEPASTKPRKGGVKQALKDARAAVKFGDKPGEVSAEVTRHADAKTIRKAKRLSGSQNQSAHALASGWLNKRVWRNGRLIKIAYNRMEALTQILNRKTHGFFDQHWKAFVRKTRRTGITRVPVSKMYDVMLDALLREPKGGGIKPLTAGQQSAFRILFDKEIADLGLRMTDVIEIPFID